VNNTLKFQKSTTKLTAEGLEHLLAPHRRLLLDTTIEVSTIIDHPRGNSLKSDRRYKPDIKLLLFNDLLVHIAEFKKDKKMSKVKNFKMDSILSNQTKDDRFTFSWPLQLVWLNENTSKTSFEVIGPTRTITITFQSDTEKNKWYDSIMRSVNQVLIEQPTFNDFEDKSNLAFTMKQRFYRYTFHTNEIYEGWWYSGSMEGEGKWEYQGCLYDGHFTNSIKEGQSTLEYPDGTVYVGNFLNGYPSGSGELISEHFQYTGEFKSGNKHGFGTILYSNGDKYEGNWTHDIIEGQGTLTLVNGLKYTGAFNGGMFHGQGILEYVDKGKYEGTFVQGSRSGNGKMTYPDTSVYTGQWKDDVKHGKGKMETPFGIYDGQWVKK